MIQATNIKKNYGKVAALRNVSFEVERGELFGIIGPDGAGKTTLFRILATLLLADEGSATVAGFDVVKDYREIRKIVGYMPGRFSLYQDLTVEENLSFFASVFGATIRQNYALIEDIYKQIEPFRNRRAGKLSGGMKQKLALCCALIHRPQVLFLDEPTTGVDAVSRKEFWAMLRRLQEQDITIVVSTPYMDEATLCDRIALTRDGAFLTIDTPQGITAKFDRPLYAVSGSDMSGLLKALRNTPDVAGCYTFGDVHHVIPEKDATLDAIREKLAACGYPDTVIRPIPVTVEDCFIALK